MTQLIKFSDQSQSFTYGVEFGRLLEKMQRNDEVIQNSGFPVRVENMQVLKDACIAYGYAAIFGDPYLDGWIDFLGIKKTYSQN